MKRAQTIIEYVFLAILTVFFVIVVISAFNFANIGSSAAFGVKTDERILTVPPMTP